MLRELKISEYEEVKEYLDIADIADIDLGKTQIFFKDDQQIMGKYQVISNNIYLPNLSSMLKELTPCIVHELTHKKQRQQLGIFKYHLLKLFSNELEEEAKKNEWLSESRLDISLMNQDDPDQNKKWYQRFMIWK